MDIRVKVYTDGGESHDIEAPSEIRTDEFIKELVSGLNLPRQDADGHQISWTLDNKDTRKPLKDDSTLEQCGVRAGHNLVIRRSITAGGRNDLAQPVDQSCAGLKRFAVCGVC